jgi:hypothetical protein
VGILQAERTGGKQRWRLARQWPITPFAFSAAAPAGIMAGMLCELAVQNLALIEDVRVELREGFCAWTGETGAGKSLLLGALGLLLGE